jgi:hypothetical protein
MGLRAPGAPQTPRSPLPEFALQRKKVEQRINADTQGQQDALQRRFAAQGMLNSGAAIKQQGIVANQAQQTREDALAGVDAAEIGEMQRRQEIQDNRDFAANEAKLGREFQASESSLGRALQASQFDRNFAQQGSQFDRNFRFQNKQFKAERGDQQRNIAASISNMKGDQLDRYNAYLISQGIKPVPKPNPTRDTNPMDRRLMNETREPIPRGGFW